MIPKSLDFARLVILFTNGIQGILISGNVAWRCNSFLGGGVEGDLLA